MEALLGERRVRRGHAGAAAAAAPADPRHAGGRERQEAPRREDEGEGRGRMGAWVGYAYCMEIAVQGRAKKNSCMLEFSRPLSAH